jgi:hypothetical protein
MVANRMPRLKAEPAIRKERSQSVEYPLRRRAKDISSALFLAIKSNELSTVQSILAQRTESNQVLVLNGAYSETVLHLAVSMNSILHSILWTSYNEDTIVVRMLLNYMRLFPENSGIDVLNGYNQKALDIALEKNNQGNQTHCTT